MIEMLVYRKGLVHIFIISVYFRVKSYNKLHMKNNPYYNLINVYKGAFYEEIIMANL